MTQCRSPRRRAVGLLAVVLAVGGLLAACEPAPPPAAPPVCAPPAHGREVPESAAVALTVESADGTRRVVTAPDATTAAAEEQVLEAGGEDVVTVAPVLPVTIALDDGPANDPYYASTASPVPYGQWGVRRIGAPEAWGAAPLRQGRDVVVAVVDTGVAGDHPGFSGRVLAGWDFTAPAAGGAPGGWVDGNGHGTHVAGTIAESDDAAGGIGVAPQVRILPVRVMDAAGTGTSDDVANGILWAVDHGADVVNLSLGSAGDSPTITDAVRYALDRGVVVVAAAGNRGGACCTNEVVSVAIEPAAECTAGFSAPLYPAAHAATPGFDGLLAVGATGVTVAASLPTVTPGTVAWLVDVGAYVRPGDPLMTVGAQTITAPVHGVVTERSLRNGWPASTGAVYARFLSADHRAPYSNVNDYITVAAPGGGVPGTSNGIYSTMPNLRYGYKSGTSMAAPHVSGVVALVRARCPALAPAQVRQRITSTAEPLGPAAAYGAGMVRADAAVGSAC